MKQAILLAGLLLAGGGGASAQLYGVGDVVNDFQMVTRTPWVRENGETVEKGEPLRLSDFGGQIVFLEFFYYW